VKPTDTSEKGLESLIVANLIGQPAGVVQENLPAVIPRLTYVPGNANDYDRDHAVDLPRLLRFMAKMHAALSEEGEGEEETYEDMINRIMEQRKLLPNASYFAFTATPKNKTLEMFGIAYKEGEQTKFKPFHSYTMKQAIQEGFILDVLKNYTPVSSYYRLIKTIEADPKFDVKKAQKKLRHYVESNDHAIRSKAEIMIDHFHDKVLGRKKLGGQARAMVVTSGIARAIQYWQAFAAYHHPLKLLRRHLQNDSANWSGVPSKKLWLLDHGYGCFPSAVSMASQRLVGSRLALSICILP
jgi:hypothetical protein